MTKFTPLLLLLIHAFTFISSATAADDDDLFLLSGQSNMDGFSTWGKSLTGNADYWLSIKSILANGDSEMKEELYNVTYEANKRHSGAEEVANTLTSELMLLYNQGLLNDLDTPLTHGKCSFVTPNKRTNELKQVSGGTVPTVWDANCGYSFGHELMLSRTLELQMGMNDTAFEMVKHSKEGTSIYKHWYPKIGQFWSGLHQTVRNRKGNWKGLIWHQGSQEVWSEKQLGEDRSLTYLGNMTDLFSQLRQEMYDASEVGTWQCKEEIPVVIVQVGYWPGGEAAQRVRDAQAEYCFNDPKAELVMSNDLSRHFHYDVASFLIIGNRIAHAYQAALKGEVACPQAAATTQSPTFQPTAVAKSLSPSPPNDKGGDKTTGDKTEDDDNGPKLTLPHAGSESKRIATVFDGTFRNFGFMFDIRTKKAITINGIELNLFDSSDYAVEIYTKMGSFKGSPESDQEAWELWYNSTVTGVGVDKPSCIGKCRTEGADDDDDDDEMMNPLECGTNERRAFYVSVPESAAVVYTKGSNNNQLYFGNEDVELYADGGVKRQGWDGKVFHPRLFSGTLLYDI